MSVYVDVRAVRAAMEQGPDEVSLPEAYSYLKNATVIVSPPFSIKDVVVAWLRLEQESDIDTNVVKACAASLILVNMSDVLSPQHKENLLRAIHTLWHHDVDPDVVAGVFEETVLNTWHAVDPDVVAGVFEENVLGG